MLEKSNVIRPSGIAFSLMTALRNHCRKNHKLHFFSLFKKRTLFKEFITSINISASAGMGKGESVWTRKQQKGRRNIQRDLRKIKRCYSFPCQTLQIWGLLLFPGISMFLNAMMKWLVMTLRHSELQSNCHRWCFMSAFTSRQNHSSFIKLVAMYKLFSSSSCVSHMALYFKSLLVPSFLSGMGTWQKSSEVPYVPKPFKKVLGSL